MKAQRWPVESYLALRSVFFMYRRIFTRRKKEKGSLRSQRSTSELAG